MKDMRRKNAAKNYERRILRWPLYHLIVDILILKEGRTFGTHYLSAIAQKVKLNGKLADNFLALEIIPRHWVFATRLGVGMKICWHNIAPLVLENYTRHEISQENLWQFQFWSHESRIYETFARSPINK